MRRSTILVLIIIVLLLFAAWHSLRTKYGVGTDTVPWLPPQARNITYVDQPLTWRLAEFQIERQAFEAWCQQQGKPLRKLAACEFEMVVRCLPCLERKGLIPPIAEPNEFLAKERRLERTLKTVATGDLYYAWHASNGGGYTLAYDIDEGKAYYQYSHH